MQHMFLSLAEFRINGDTIALLAVSGAFLLPIIALVFGSIRRIVVGCARERSRREIAAYIAEGSMTPEEGERLLAAGERKRIWRDGCC